MDETVANVTSSSTGTPQGGAATMEPPAGTSAPVSPGATARNDQPAKPPESLEQQVARRVKSGESLDTIKAERAVEARTPKTSTKAADPENPATPQPGTKTDSTERYGLSEKDFNTLKRRGIEPGEWLKSIPESNRKAIIQQAQAAQAADDRAFQQQQAAKKQGADGSTKPASEPGAGGVAAGGQGEAGSSDKANLEGQQQGAEQQAAPPPVFQPYRMSQESLSKLNELGGKDVGDFFHSELSKMADHYTQMLTPLMGVLEFVTDRLEEADFGEALGELTKQPGYDQLNDEQKKTLRDEASNLIRAKGDLKQYGFKQALPIAAAGLFRMDVHKQAQAQLAGRRASALTGTLGRTEQKPIERTPLTPSKRMAEIGRLMASGISGAEARRQVDGD